MAELISKSLPIFRKHHENINLVNILQDITSFPQASWKDEHQCISNTDYYLRNQKTDYWELAFPTISAFLNGIVHDKLKQFDSWQIPNRLFQVYEQGDFHGWHVHGNSMFAGVFYISVDGVGALQTRDQSAQYLAVKTGDIILFPSFLEHRVAPQESKNKRIVIAFNVNFDKL